MNKKLHIKKGDMVIVITGNDKKKQGRVLEVFPKKDKAIVEGVNIISKHTKPNSENPQGGIIKKEAPIHISNLMIVCPETGKATKIGREERNGKLVRYSKKSTNKQEIK